MTDLDRGLCQYPAALRVGARRRADRFAGQRRPQEPSGLRGRWVEGLGGLGLRAAGRALDRPARQAERAAPARSGACSTPRRRASTSYPGGHAEGFPDTFKQLYRQVYRGNRGRSAAGRAGLSDL